MLIIDQETITLEDILKKKKLKELKNIAFRMDVEHPDSKASAPQWA